MTVLSEVLNGSSESPFYKDLVRDGRVAAGVEHDEIPGVQYPNLLVFYVATKHPYTNQTVLRKFDESLDKFLQSPIDPHLLENAKRSIAVSYLGQMKSDMDLARGLGSSELQFGDWKAMFDWYHEAMRVSDTDVQKIARRYLTRRNRTVGFLEVGDKR